MVLPASLGRLVHLVTQEDLEELAELASLEQL